LLDKLRILSVFLTTPIEYLKGVGPARAEILQKELGIFTFGDLLEHYPFRYIDRSKFFKTTELEADMPFIQLKGRVSDFRLSGPPRKQILKGTFYDEFGSVELIWFKGAKWIRNAIKEDVEYVLFGKPNRYKGVLNIAHPELDDVKDFKPQGSFQAVYPLTDKLRNKKVDNKTIRKMMVELFRHDHFKVDEILPKWILDREDLISRELALKWIHLPDNNKEQLIAQKRLKFEEFFTLQAGVMRSKKKRMQRKGIPFWKVGTYFHKYFENKMSFELTGAQKRVMKEIRADMGSGRQMNRLLQGDVGSGKSIVALLTMLIAIDNGFQASLMAPTEILATQHFANFSEDLRDIGIECALLTGSTKKAERTRIHEGLMSGEIKILIGTHALIEDPVKLQKQGLVIIDEQHRFGVAQRAKLWKKSSFDPHVLVMTATPIPRTLAMTVYGDLDVSKIDELPSGRKEIKTAVRNEANRLRVWGFVKEEIAKGRQVYMVYPLIEESPKLDYKNLQEAYDQALEYFPRPEYQIQMLHGRMKPEDKDDAMRRFKEGIVQIMISTTVIEVGINVPNATVMIIESAEKFGLAQLHQLRGRVGRGSEQSYCILMTGNKISRDGKQRLRAMEQTNDGFEIAELDLRLRGPGDIEGTQQSGLATLKLASVVHDEDLLDRSRACIEILMDADPELTKPEHRALQEFLVGSKLYKDWSNIS